MHDSPSDLESRWRVSPIEVACVLLMVASAALVIRQFEVLGLVLVLASLGLSILSVGRRIEGAMRHRPRVVEPIDPPNVAILSILERMAQSLESPAQHARFSRDHDALGPIREAMNDGRWEEVNERVELLRSQDDLSEEFAAEVATKRETAVASLRARLDASRQANDAQSVLEFRAQLLPLVSEEMRGPLDADLIRWFMALLMRRMRAGTVRADVAELAQAISEAFPSTSEGASLRASLPTLRRSAGLCPRCAQPYTGTDEACARCLGKVVPVEIESLDQDDDPPVDRSDEEDPFLPSD